ncbi:DUF982 domain-containing protein [Rhizobium mongolense]|uniref:DUF982 domain-containing protein n=1 Tax=Rhizobium TaxID=379 RepID=UPI0024B22FEF|nr:DUF982 domain-containing protein [Rhizobium sp. CC1099]WFU90305.1 DUF982 domain-containing protein [Rhizobium sp. CC1099]
MSNRRWDHPVMIICRRTGQLSTIASTAEALEVLTNSWPVADGKAFMAALLICSDVEAGIREPDEARASFIAAAKEAGVPFDTMGG